MSRFVTTLKAEQLDRRKHVLLSELVWEDGDTSATVPAGFVTDFASIKALHNAFLFPLYALVSGYGNYAATLHDWLYVTGQVGRKEADAVLYRALRSEGVARWRAWIFWAGVRLGGSRNYKK